MAPRRFSERLGVTSAPLLDLDEMSDNLRVALWNRLQPNLFEGNDSQYGWVKRVEVAYEFLHWRKSSLAYNPNSETRKLEEWFFDAEWYEIYDIIEHFAAWLDRNCLNEILEREGSPYRFIGDVLTQITDEAELAEVLDAQQHSDRFAGARTHITEALRMLGQRPVPDYRNAIKEAISAVESTLKVQTDEDHAQLSAALRKFQIAHPIHGSLFAGLNSLYGYTSNEKGVRHALMESEANVGFAEAKFMIVACAAFMNYLILRSSE